MAINWFEGGRRVSKLFMALVALGGATSVIFAGQPIPTVASDGPGEPWRIAQGCDTPDYARFLWNYGWDGPESDLMLCFVAASNDGIPYATAAEPPAAARSRAEETVRLKAEDEARMARGEPPPLRSIASPRKWYFTEREYSDEVQSYVRERVASFRLTPELRQQLIDGRAAAHWRQRWAAFNDALPWVFGVIAFIWVFAAVTGWIIRGFAGVPQGQDFKPTAGA